MILQPSRSRRSYTLLPYRHLFVSQFLSFVRRLACYLFHHPTAKPPRRFAFGAGKQAGDPVAAGVDRDPEGLDEPFGGEVAREHRRRGEGDAEADRKSTRLNSSH